MGQRLATRKVLAISGDEALRAQVISLLQDEGCTVLEAPDARSGLERAIAAQPDAVLCDIEVGPAGGFELLDVLRGRPDTRAIPFVVLAGLFDPHLSARMEGVDGTVVKPCSRDQLLLVLGRAVEAREPSAPSGGAQLQNGSIFHGRYRINHPLAIGASGIVYEVHDLNTDRLVALKAMLPSLAMDARLRARFLAEGKITARIESEHVVRVTDAGFDARGIPFVVMELLRGEDLEGYLRRVGSLPPRETYKLVRQAAAALDRIHEHGIVHRDFTPRNLFLTRRENRSRLLKVLDFGASKVLADASGTSGLVGTPCYMAPEQIRRAAQAMRGEPREKIGPACDLYALAHVAYTLLVGIPYWEREGVSILPHLQLIAAGTVEPASARARASGTTLAEEIAGPFDEWFACATAVDPRDRFPNGSAMARQLRHALGYGRVSTP